MPRREKYAPLLVNRFRRMKLKTIGRDTMKTGKIEKGSMKRESPMFISKLVFNSKDTNFSCCNVSRNKVVLSWQTSCLPLRGQRS